MKFTTELKGREPEITGLFRETFAASEGQEEGEVVGALVGALIGETRHEDLRFFAAEDEGKFIGAIFFSRLLFAKDSRVVFLLAPVAVATERQGQGIGQKLIQHGLARLRDAKTDIAVTYGDPEFYGRVGFLPVSEEKLPAPFALQHPQGWQARSLIKTPLSSFAGPPQCVSAFDDPSYW